jgi:prepilin-type N-terminal cleavage/methylation domain-containing protein
MLRKRGAFTLIELLVVIAIIAILAGLGFAGVSGAIKTARKAEVRAMANQVKLALTAYYADYGVWPTNVTKTSAPFLSMMMGTSTNGNRRATRYLEPASKFTNSSGLVTPPKFYTSVQSNFIVIVDTNYDGMIRLPGQAADSPGSVAVYVTDPDSSTKYIGTW